MLKFLDNKSRNLIPVVWVFTATAFGELLNQAWREYQRCQSGENCGARFSADAEEVRPLMVRGGTISYIHECLVPPHSFASEGDRAWRSELRRLTEWINKLRS